MSNQQELEVKAEEIFRMTFGALALDPDDADDAKSIVNAAVNDGLVAMPDAEDMEDCLDDFARDAQEKMRDDIYEHVLSVEKTIIKTYVLATGGPAYGVEVRYADYDGGREEVDSVWFWYQDWFTPKGYYPVPDDMVDVVLDALGIEY